MVSVEFEKSTYPVIPESTANGTLSVNKQNASSGETVTITAVPDNGYEIESVKILKADDDSDVTGLVSYNSENNTFIMPSYAVKVSAEFMETDTPEDNPKPDHSPITGDNLPVYLYALVMIISYGVLMILKTRKNGKV